MIRTWLVSYPIEIGIFKPIHLQKDQNTFQICTESSHNDFSNYHGFCIHRIAAVVGLANRSPRMREIEV